MANHAGGWASGARVCFGSLDLIVNTDRALERIQAPAPHGGYHAVVEDLRVMQLLSREGNVSPYLQNCGLDSTRLGL